MQDAMKLVEAWLALMPQGEFNEFPGKISSDLVLRLPFMPKGLPNEYKGRELVRSILQSSAEARDPLVFTGKQILRTEDPELFVVTASASTLMKNGRLYENSYVIFVRIRDGMVLEHVEYLNPLPMLEAIGKTD